MMTPQEIVKEINKLPPLQKKEVIDAIVEKENESSASEQEFLNALFSEGIIGNIPNPDGYTDEEDNFEPIEIGGKPTSEVIIEERR